MDLLYENQGSPKAIFLAGAPASGKSYLSKQLIPSSFTRINVDDWYEELLKKSGLGTKQKDFSPEELSQAGSLMTQARELSKKDLDIWSNKKSNLLIDGTGASSKTLLAKKQELEGLGYQCLMIMVYVSPLTALERNKQRDRSLIPGIILRTWRDVYNNINTFKTSFKDNFVLINNDLKNSNKEFNSELIKPYLEDSLAKGKPKTPEEQAKSNADKDKLNQDIKKMVQNEPKFDTLEVTKTKINNFINGR